MMCAGVYFLDSLIIFFAFKLYLKFKNHDRDAVSHC